MLICIKQRQRKIWRSLHKKVKQHWGWAEEKRVTEKKPSGPTIWNERKIYVYKKSF